ncbi:MAG: NBR1-Ig-like domain-containing protein [Anaerolineales bacterium]
MRKLRPVWVLLSLVTLLLVACRSGTPAEPTATGPAPEAVRTAAAQTASARMTDIAAITPTAAPATPTLSPTETSPVTPTLTITPTVEISGEDRLEFVADITVPDGTIFKPGETFVKTWRLENTGTSTWSSGHALVFISGEQMGAPASVPLSITVPPGETGDVSVSLTAPNSPGSYFSFWMLRGPAGNNFGLGPTNDQPFYVQIVVSGSGSGSTPPPGASGNTVTEVSLAVDNANVQEACPHTFYFAARFVLNKPATVSYALEAETGFPITLPAPTTVALDAGVHTLTYTLDFQDDVSGTAQFVVTAPESVQSSPVSFSLDCQ